MTKPTCLLPFVVLASSLTAEGAVARFWGGEATAGITTSVTYDNNVQARRDGDDGLILRGSIGADWKRRLRFADVGFGLSLQSGTYLLSPLGDYTDWSYNLFFSPDAGYTFGESRFVVSFVSDISRDTQVDVDVGRVVTTTSYFVSAPISYIPNRSWRLTFTPSWDKNEPQDDDLSGTEKIDLELIGTRVFADEFSVFAGTAFSAVDQQRIDSTDYTSQRYFVGVSRQITARINARVSAGVQTRELDGAEGTDSTPYLNASAGWEVGPLTSLALSASRSFGSSLSAQATVNTDVTLSVSHRFSQRLTGSASVFVAREELERPEQLSSGTQSFLEVGDNYIVFPESTGTETRSARFVRFFGSERTDDRVGGDVGVTYSFAKLGRVSLRLSYEDQQTDEVVSQPLVLSTPVGTFPRFAEGTELGADGRPILEPLRADQTIEDSEFDHDRFTISLSWSVTF